MSVRYHHSVYPLLISFNGAQSASLLQIMCAILHSIPKLLLLSTIYSDNTFQCKSLGMIRLNHSISNLNPFTLRAAKRGLTIWEIFSLQKHFFLNIWERNVNQKTNNKSPSNILWNFAFISKLFSKVWKKQTIFGEEVVSVNGLRKDWKYSVEKGTCHSILGLTMDCNFL